MVWDKDKLKEELKHQRKVEKSIKKGQDNVPDPEKVKESKERKQNMTELLWKNDWESFKRTLIDGYGLQEGSEDYKLAVQAWNEHQARLRALKRS